MIPNPDMDCAVFAGDRLIARGAPRAVLPAMKAASEAGEAVLAFDLATGRTVEFDLRGDLETALGRLPQVLPEAKKGPGRPKLGVTAREVTLLPRHWDWLSSQPGGASATLRKMVETALREAEGPDRIRHAREAAYRFITAMAGDLPNYEEATRMLFAGDRTAFEAAVKDWPEGVRDTALGMAELSGRNAHGR
ncbi:DUF2239 family protein [Brevundimonas sp. SORGH_AS_0993]|uniref:DUF2239 family protein n=1 Tax=Brevundimonas sp. SORGH_AS_0993 TaxID=3041794 RepID=UPI0027829900|nr:DUF2239 family protein [Brevundimonas sp. SORGH_AS_0993]MDQ1153157.1 hypothetical protein [Brevundimonas sp. SORGH_AS_0993]